MSIKATGLEEWREDFGFSPLLADENHNLSTKIRSWTISEHTLKRKVWAAKILTSVDASDSRRRSAMTTGQESGYRIGIGKL